MSTPGQQVNTTEAELEAVALRKLMVAQCWLANNDFTANKDGGTGVEPCTFGVKSRYKVLK